MGASFFFPIKKFGNYVESALALWKSYQVEILIALCVLFLISIFRELWRWKRNKFPPGPWFTLPIVGHLPLITDFPHLKFIELSKTYGDVFSLRMGSRTMVVLCGYDAIKELHSRDEFLARPPHNSFSLIERKSPFFALGLDVWKEQRRFVLQSMKDLGLGKSKIENHIMDEVDHFLYFIKSHHGNPVDLKAPLTPSMSNNICSLVFGERYDYKDPERMKLDQSLNTVTKLIAQTSSHTFIPWLKHVPFALKWLNLEKGRHFFKEVEKILKKKIDAHKQSLDPSNVRDYIDSYLVEMKSRKEKDPNTTLSEETLMGTVQDLFGAGSETVRTTILWCVYTMAAYPHVQKKIQNEIMDVIGTERKPEFLDMKHMPYTQAVIQEILRWKTIVPVSVLRQTMSETTLGGYQIPVGAVILANFWAVHHDPKLWPEPDVFKPERFLGSDGRLLKRSPYYMPFSLGKRSCPGEAMAHLEIFLYFTSLLQSFDIVFPEGVEPTFKAKMTITYSPESYTVRFIQKNRT